MSLSGNPLDYLFAFFGGVLMSFSPCVYPLLPVTLGYIGASTSGSAKRGLTLSLIYVTGIAVTYAALGLAASLTGTIFGSISSHPIAYLAVGAVIIFFGLTMSGFFSFNLPNFIKLPAIKKENYLSVFFLGLISGLVISPCLSPVLGTILAVLITQKNLIYGASLLIVFAYGMGLTLILAGTFSAFLAQLPKSGKWMIYVKRLYSVILIMAGIYFIYSGIRRM